MKRLNLVALVLAALQTIACADASAPHVASGGAGAAGSGDATQTAFGPAMSTSAGSGSGGTEPSGAGNAGIATSGGASLSSGGGGAGGSASGGAADPGGAGSAGTGSGGSGAGPAPQVRSGCESVEHDGHVYALCRDAKVAFPVARKDCEVMSMQLIRLDSAAESTWIYETFYAKPATPGGDGSQMWVGGTDTGVEGEWRWLIGGDMFWQGKADGMATGGLYTFWGRAHGIGAQDQPNDAHSAEGEDCMVIRGPTENEGGKWTDISCANENVPPAPDTRLGWYTCESL